MQSVRIKTLTNYNSIIFNGRCLHRVLICENIIDALDGLAKMKHKYTEMKIKEVKLIDDLQLFNLKYAVTPKFNFEKVRIIVPKKHANILNKTISNFNT